MKKYIPIIVAAAIVVAVIAGLALAYGVEKGKADQAAKVAKLIEEKYAGLLAERDAKIGALEQNDAKKSEELATIKKSVVQLTADLASEKAAAKKREDEIRNAPPSEQVAEAKRILEVPQDSIWLTPRSTVEFTLAAFSEASVKFAGWEGLTKREIPRYDKLVAEKAAEAAKEHELYVNQVATTEEWKGKFNLSEQKFEDYKKNVPKPKGWFAKAVDTTLKIGAGIAIGYVVHEVVK